MDEILAILKEFQTLATGILAIGAAFIAFYGARKQANAAVEASQLQIAADRENDAVKALNDRQTLAGILQLQIGAYVADLISVRWQLSEAVRLKDELNAEQIQIIRAITSPDFAKYRWQELSLLGPHLAGAVLTFVEQADELLKTIQKRLPQIMACKPPPDVLSAFANPFIVLLGERCDILVNLCEKLAAITPNMIDIAMMKAGATQVAEEIEKNPHIRALRVAAGIVPAETDASPGAPR